MSRPVPVRARRAVRAAVRPRGVPLLRHWLHRGHLQLLPPLALLPPVGRGQVSSSASKSFIRRLVNTEKAPTRAFSWLKAATTAFTFKILLRHYAKGVLTPW